MTNEDLPDLLNAYWRLVRDEAGDWTPLVARFANVVDILHEGDVDKLAEQAQELPFPALLVGLGLHLNDRTTAAIGLLVEARAEFVGDGELGEPVNAAFTDESIARLRAQNRAATLAAFLASYGAAEHALQLFEDLERAGRRRSLWETYLITRCLMAVDQPSGALRVALQGVEELLQRRQRLDNGALRLNFGGRVGAGLLTIAAAAALRRGNDEESSRLALYLFELGRDPLLAEIVHTINRAPLPILLQLGVIRQSWSAEAEAFQWRELIARGVMSAGADASHLDTKLATAESAIRTAKSELRQKAPLLYSTFFAPGRTLLRSPVERAVVANAQKQLPPDACVIGYDIAERDVFGWTLTREHLSLERLQISAEELATHVASVHTSCQTGRLASDSHLQPLANALLEFAANRLDSSTRLMIVPSGPLRALPFAVLPWRGRALVSAHTCSVLPSLGLIGDLASRTQSAVKKPTIASFGNPTNMRWTSPTDKVEAARPLPHTEREAREVSKLTGTEPHCGETATRQAVLTSLQSADIVHLATHAVFCSEAPLFSAFLLAEGEQLSVVDLMAVESRCSLVVASACSTGEGRPTSGNDVLGISRGLLGCGASAAVVSLWPVDDEQTANLMIALYRRLLDRMDPARALCEAQRDFLDAGPRIVTQARHLVAETVTSIGASGPERWWAPFVLVGM